MTIGKKRFKFFWALAWDTIQVRHDLSPLLSRILCSSLLFVDDLFSVCFSGALCISFSRCSLLDIRLFTYTFYCSLWRSSRRILPILASCLTFFRVFLDSLYAFYFLLSLVALSLSFQPIFTHNPFSTNLNYNKFLCRYFCFASWLEIAKYWEFLFNFNLTSLISRSKRGLQIICLRGLTSTNSHAMPNHVPAVRWVRGTSSLEYAHFIVIYRCLLLHTTEAGGVRTPIALHCGSSIFNMAMKAAEIGRFWLNIPLKLGRSFFLSP